MIHIVWPDGHLNDKDTNIHAGKWGMISATDKRYIVAGGFILTGIFGPIISGHEPISAVKQYISEPLSEALSGLAVFLVTVGGAMLGASLALVWKEMDEKRRRGSQARSSD